jgi:hypothetical protein
MGAVRGWAATAPVVVAGGAADRAEAICRQRAPAAPVVVGELERLS